MLSNIMSFILNSCKNSIPPVEDILLNELEQLSRISSSHVLPATHIVTDRFNTGRFRGFLQIYCPAGSLKDVLSSLHKIPPPSSWNLWGATGQKARPFHISWTVKHRWCIQMTHALLDLHEQESYIGRLTPGSFLIDQDGNVKLIGHILKGLFQPSLRRTRGFQDPDWA